MEPEKKFEWTDEDVSDPIVDIVVEFLDKGENILLHAPGGTGKTHCLRNLAKVLVAAGKSVAMTSTTGISAINLAVPQGGLLPRTLHSWAGVDLAQDTPDKLYWKVFHKEKARRRWVTTDILIIDEVSMLGAAFLDKLDYVAKHVRRAHDKPFGGIQLVASGDFLQLPPVKDGWVFEASAWNELDFRCVMFDEPKRYDDTEYFNLLLRVREGAPSKKDIEKLQGCVKKYDEWKKTLRGGSSDLVVKPTILFSKKVDVEIYNETELAKLPGQVKEYVSHDTYTKYCRDARVEYYTPLLEDAIPRIVKLKVGAQVMLKRNLDIDAGLVNGSRGVVLAMTNEEVTVKFMKGAIMHVPLVRWDIEDKEAKASRTQIPFIVAYALTIHKCQGCTLDCAICDLGPSIFSAGQAYVALSRVRNMKGLYLSEFTPESIKVDEKALKFVNTLKNM